MINKIFRIIRQPQTELMSFYNQLSRFKKLDSLKRFPINKEDLYPCLNDNTNSTNFDAHYIYHPAWAARIVKKIDPEFHIDISSTLHFCTLLSAFIPVKFYDYRPAILSLNNLVSGKADLTNLLFKDNSVSCVSCMHTIEHIGLGRYGDELDPDGDIKAINELKRICKPGGNILFVVPVGKPLLRFNAHRIYSPKIILDYFAGFELLDFSLVTDNGTFVSPSEIKLGDQQDYGCGCFWFKKLNDCS
ncbi:MAG: DUF268 domain-containing protein [Pyrinomonadaceae bacterium]|nr:DUF268 domain-containing protein [Sphingobacteriaceae bacterium]